jgi:hypothetical protein
MIADTFSTQGLAGFVAGRHRLVALLSLSAVLAGIGGCGSEEPKVSPPAIETVEAYGQTLDESATPEQVVFVLLQAIRDDFHTSPENSKAREELVDLQYKLSAYSALKRRLTEANRIRPGMNAAEVVRELVYHWTPILAHYVESFDEDFEQARRKMRVRPLADGEGLYVFYPVHRSHGPDAEVADTVIVNIELRPEKAGGLEYWRVARISFEGSISAPGQPKPPEEPDADDGTSSEDNE